MAKFTDQLIELHTAALEKLQERKVFLHSEFKNYAKASTLEYVELMEQIFKLQNSKLNAKKIFTLHSDQITPVGQ